LPFAGYNMGQYLQHWLDMQEKIPYPPKLFQVNWFRKGRDGKFLWPGFGENMRVLKWIIDRAHGRIGAQETHIGWVPRVTDLDLSDIGVPSERVAEARAIDHAEWRRELESLDEWFEKCGSHMPKALR